MEYFFNSDALWFDMPNGKNYQKKFKKFSYFLVNFYFFMPCP